MKITVKSNTLEKTRAIIDELDPGIVFQFNNIEVKALKLHNEKVVLLNYSTGRTWLELYDGSMDYHGIKTLGYLNEIVVGR